MSSTGEWRPDLENDDPRSLSRSERWTFNQADWTLTFGCRLRSRCAVEDRTAKTPSTRSSNWLGLWHGRRVLATLGIFLVIATLTIGMVITAVLFARRNDAFGYAFLRTILVLCGLAAALG